MPYLEATARICEIVESVTPTLLRDTLFKRLQDKNTAETVSPIVSRRFQLQPREARRGPAVCGTGAKQVIQRFTLTTVYVRTEKDDTINMLQIDSQLVRSALENTANYNGKVQNIETLDFTFARATDRVLADWTLEVTYTGDA